MLALKLLLALMSSTSADPSFPKDSPIAAAVDTPVELQLDGGDDKTVWSTSPEKLIIKDGQLVKTVKGPSATITSKGEAEVTVTAKVDGKDFQHKVTFFDHDAAFDLVCKVDGKEVPMTGNKLSIYEGSSAQLFVVRTDKNGPGVVRWPLETNSAIKYTDADEKPTRQANSFRTLRAEQTGSETITVTSAINPRVAFQLEVNVLAKQGEIKVAPLKARVGIPTEITVSGLTNGYEYILQSTSPIFPGESTSVKVNSERPNANILPKEPGSLTLKVIPPNGVGANQVNTDIAVEPEITGIELVPAGTASSSLMVFQRQQFRVRVLAGRLPVEGAKVFIKSAQILPEGLGNVYFKEDSEFIEIEPTSIDAESVRIAVTIQIDGATVPSKQENVFFAEAKIRVLRVEGFKNVNVQLVPMDDKMVEHLYGVQTRRQFYVYQVRINNNLMNESNQPSQKSIVAYSASLGTGVTLEKWAKDSAQRVKDAGVGNQEVANGGWLPVTIRDYDGQFSHTPQLGTGDYAKVEELGASTSGLSPTRGTLMVNQSLVLRVGLGGRKMASVKTKFEVRNERGELVNETIIGNSGDRSMVFRATGAGKYLVIAKTTYSPIIEEAGKDPSKGSPVTDTFTSEFMVVDPTKAAKVFTYNPYRFAIMESTSSIRAEADGRNRAVSVMEAIGSIGTFILNVFEAKGQVPNLISNWSNVIIPGYKRYAPSLTEIQRANLIRDIMQPMEEIAYGQDIERTVFFPRGPFEGVIRGYKTRISAIDVSRYQIQIAVVDTKATINSGGGQSGVTAPPRTGGGR